MPGHKKESAWIKEIRKHYKKGGVSWKDAMIMAQKTYKPKAKPSMRGAGLLDKAFETVGVASTASVAELKAATEAISELLETEKRKLQQATTETTQKINSFSTKANQSQKKVKQAVEKAQQVSLKVQQAVNEIKNTAQIAASAKQVAEKAKLDLKDLVEDYNIKLAKGKETKEKILGDINRLKTELETLANEKKVQFTQSTNAISQSTLRDLEAKISNTMDEKVTSELSNLEERIEEFENMVTKAESVVADKIKAATADIITNINATNATVIQNANAALQQAKSMKQASKKEVQQAINLRNAVEESVQTVRADFNLLSNAFQKVKEMDGFKALQNIQSAQRSAVNKISQAVQQKQSQLKRIEDRINDAQKSLGVYQDIQNKEGEYTLLMNDIVGKLTAMRQGQQASKRRMQQVEQWANKIENLKDTITALQRAAQASGM